MKFTSTEISRLAKPEKVTDYRDPKYPNLVLKVTPNGSKAFYFVINKGGQRVNIKIARYVDKAQLLDIFIKYRDMYLAYHTGTLQMPTKPAPVVPEVPAVPAYTLAQAVEDYIAWAMVNKARSTWYNAKLTYNKHLVPVLGTKAVTDINKADIVKIIDNMVANGYNTGAIATLNKFKALFTYLVDRDHIQVSPVASIKNPNVAPVKATTALSDAELKQFLQAVDASNSTDEMKDIIRLMVYTGARRSEVVGVKADEIDLTSKVWNLGTSRRLKTKTSKRSIPLPDYLCEIFKRNPKQFDYHEDSVSNAISTISGNVTAHKLRHTFITLCARLGIDREVSKAITGHSNADIHAVYNHHNYLAEARVAMDTICNHIKGL